MSGPEYTVFVDDQPATRELMQAIDEIEVSQLTGDAWEAQLVIPIAMDRHGQWEHESQHYVTGRTRFRIELHAGGEPVTLIDGITVGVDLELSGDPGQSTVTVRVQDHTAELDRDRAPRTSEPNERTEDVIRGLFQDRATIEATPEITLPPEEGPETHAPRALTMTQESAYDYLKRLASDLGCYVFVLPTSTRGRSRAVFGPLPTPTGDLGDPLVLAGPARNIEGFRVETQRERPGRTEVRHLDVRNRAVETRSISLRDDAPADGESASDDGVEAIQRPGHAAAVGPQTAGTATLERHRFSIRASGVIEGRCYPGVLQPYRHVEVRGVNAVLSGTYLVHAVTHTLSRAGYRQAFTLWRDTVSTGSEAPAGSPH